METELSTPKTRRESEVWQACDDLWAQSASTRYLTGDNIRDQLVRLGYKRGSPNEIYRYRSSWRDSRGIADASENPESSARESDPISRAVSMVYDQMRTQTNDAIDKLTEEYEIRLKAALLEEETLKQAIVLLRDSNTSLEKAVASCKLKINELEDLLSQEKQANLILNERLKGAREQSEAVSVQHQSLIVELKSFHEREIDLWRAQNIQASAALGEQRKQLQAELERQGAVFSEELMQLKTALRQTQEEREQAKARSASLEESIKETKKSAEGLEAECLRQRKSALEAMIELGVSKKSMESETKEKIRWQRIVERYLRRSSKKSTS